MNKRPEVSWKFVAALRHFSFWEISLVKLTGEGSTSSEFVKIINEVLSETISEV